MNTDFNYIQVIETPSGETHTGQAKLLRETSSVTESFLMLLFGFVMSFTIAVSLTKLLSKKISEREFIARSSKIPCPGCRFFSNSAHLRCAVNPTTTMTQEAINCADYCPQTKE